MAMEEHSLPPGSWTGPAARHRAVVPSHAAGQAPLSATAGSQPQTQRWRCRKDESGVSIKKKQQLKITLVAKTTTVGARLLRDPPTP